MKFEILSESEYDAFASAWPGASFLQSVMMATRRKNDGWTPHFVGVRASDGTLRGVAHISMRPVFLGYCDAECQQGPLVDASDTEAMTFLLREMRQYVAQHKAVTLVINPPILAHHRDGDAAVLDDGYDAQGYCDIYTKLGYRHIPNESVDVNPHWLRWFFRKDLRDIVSDNELMNSFAQQTRWSVRKALKSGVRVRRIDKSELDAFYQLLVATSDRRHFHTRSREYFASLMAMGNADQVQFMVAELPVLEYKEKLRELRTEAENAMDAHDQTSSDKKERTAYRVAHEAVQHYGKKLDDADTMADGREVILLAASVFIAYGGQMTYFMSGADTTYREFCGPYALQWHAMNDARRQHLASYNFYGTRGDFSGHPDQQGVYEFKRGFGGVVEEQIGYFEAVPYPLIHRIRRLVQKFR